MQDGAAFELVDGIYEAALEPERWPAALKSIGAAISNASCIMAVHPWTGGVEWAVLADLDKQLLAKTNTRRQAELIRLVLQFPPLSPR